MKHEVILSGFGGQGVMSIGKNLVEGPGNARRHGELYGYFER